MSAYKPAALVDELFWWKFLGAATWQGAAFTLAYNGWAVTASLRHPLSAALPGFNIAATFSYLTLLALQVAVLITHRSVMSASESPPVYLPALGLHSRGWLGLLFSRVILRTRKIQDVISVLLLLAATCGSAATSLLLYPQVHYEQGSRPSFAFRLAYALVLGSLYTVEHLARCRDVLAYPPSYKRRWFRMRDRLIPCILYAIKLSVSALLITLVTGQRPTSVTAALASLHTASLAVFGWLAAQTCLEVVFTEPLRLTQRLVPTQDPVKVTLEAMRTDNAIAQDLTLQDVVSLCEGYTSSDRSWRACVWSDDTGMAGWTPLATFLSGEVRDWVSTVAGALPGAPGSSQAGVPSSGAAKVQWNVLAVSSTTGTQGISRGQDLAAWTVRAKCDRVCFCLRALSSLTASSRKEDQYGLVLMSSPVLGDVTLLLLSVVLVTQAYTKTGVSQSTRLTRSIQRVLDLTGPPSHPSLQQAEELTWAIGDLAKGCAHRLVSQFGKGLVNAVGAARDKPAYGSPAELQTLLNTLITYKE